MEKGQIFDVEIDGVDKKAELIDIIEYNGEEYAVYSTENDDTSNDIYVSKIVQDAEGYDELVEVEDPEVKEYVMNIIEESLNS